MAERRLLFEDFYRAQRAGLVGAVVFALGDTDFPEGSMLVVHEQADDGGWDQALRAGCGV